MRGEAEGTPLKFKGINQRMKKEMVKQNWSFLVHPGKELILELSEPIPEIIQDV